MSDDEQNGQSSSAREPNYSVPEWRVIDPHAALMRVDLYAIERQISEIRELIAAPPTVSCRACGGTGSVNRGYGDWNGKAWVGGGMHVCSGCHGAGVHRV